MAIIANEDSMSSKSLDSDDSSDESATINSSNMSKSPTIPNPSYILNKIISKNKVPTSGMDFVFMPLLIDDGPNSFSVDS